MVFIIFSFLLQILSFVFGLFLIKNAKRIESWGWNKFMPILREKAKNFHSEKETTNDYAWQRPITIWLIRFFGLFQVCVSLFTIIFQLLSLSGLIK